ncbi:RHS repeat-associated core domain-containing protein [Burkholderia cepacia]|uniref:RHS repeat-associated core domain-containing protein n=1 Tax=Burkholderia cepacia TaxID=292 RepID=UPI00158C846E|nr:RHS repeat-associated core domain-containing protein [Burkholderia cepacia]
MSDSENRLTRASDPPASDKNQSESKVNTACDALLDTVQSTCDSFKETFSAKGSALHHVSEAVNALAALQGAPSQLLNTGIAQIPLLGKMPGMPAAVISAPHLGTPHAHSHPPSNGFPLPSMGATIGSGCLSVLIGGMPAARVQDIGIAPTCGGLTPYFNIETGSSNTFIGGMRAARMGIDMTRHCNPMGHAGKSGEEAEGAAEKGEEAASDAAEVSSRARWMGRAGKAWKVGNAAIGPASGVAGAASGLKHHEALAAAMMAAQTAADAAMMALSNLMGKDPGIEPSMGMLMDGNPTVLIGGFPLPDSQMMWHGIKHGIGKKVRAGIAAARQKGAGPCRDGHPVDVVRGTAENEFVDYEAHSAPAFKWERYYCSGWSEQDGALGFGFRHCFQHELHLLRTQAIYVDALNREYPIRRNAAGRYEGVFAGYELEQHDGRRFVLSHGRFGDMIFERASEGDRTARLVSHIRHGVESTLECARNGALMRIVQEEGRGLRRQLIDFRYDDRGHIVELYLTDPQGETKRIVHYRYDTAGCLVASTNPLGAVMSHGYDGRRRMVRETDANGYSFSYQYDIQDRCIESMGQDGLWHVSLDYQPGRTVVTRADGGKWTFLYDEARTVTRIVDPYGGTTERVIGDDGRILHEIDSGGRVMRWLYDERGGNTGRMDRWGNRWPTKDEAPVLPNPLAHTVPNTPLALQWGDARHEELADTLLLPPEIAKIAASLFPPQPVSASTEQCDGAGRVIARTDGYGQAERLRLDATGNLLQLCDRDGRDYCYNISSWNLRESETNPLGNTVRYRYSPKQEITAIVDANGNESTYTYDYKSRVTSIKRHYTLRETYAYDVGDRLIEKHDGAGNVLLRLEVGDNGLHSKRILASGDRHTYEYDRRGNVTMASTDKFDVTLTYDVYGRRTADKRDGSGIEHSFTGRRLESTTYFGRFVVRYETGPADDLVIHTPGGGVQRLQHAADGTVLLRLGNRTNVLYRFDADGRCTGRLNWLEGRTTETRYVQYRYSAVGELRCVIDSTGGTTEYQYDAAHRLVGESRDGLAVRRFEYDRGGNLLSTPTCQWMRYTEGNRLSGAACGEFRYNGRNHLAEQIGENNRRTIYRYNSMDLLVQVKWSDRDDVWTADYDGLCRRVCKAMNGAQTDFYWDGDRLAAEKGPDGQLRIYLYVNEKAFLPFMFIDYPTEQALPESGQAYFVFCAQSGLPEWIENSHGRKVWNSLSSDPYGLLDVAEAEGERVDYNLRWPGHYFDPETALHYNRFRSYSPRLGRYLQSDPAGQSGGINLYAYTANPLTCVDVMGLQCPHGNKTETECPECGRISEDPEVARLSNEITLWEAFQKEDLADEFFKNDIFMDESDNLGQPPPDRATLYWNADEIIQSLKKQLEEARKAADRRPLVDKYAEKLLSNKPWRWEDFSDNLTESEKIKIRDQAINEGLVPRVPYKPKLNDDGSVMLDEDGNVIPSRYPDFSKVTYIGGEPYSVIDTWVSVPKDRWKQGDTAQFNWANGQRGGDKEGYTWHHSEIDGRMERVPFGLHNMISHDGGRSPGHWAEGGR